MSHPLIHTASLYEFNGSIIHPVILETGQAIRCIEIHQHVIPGLLPDQARPIPNVFRLNPVDNFAHTQTIAVIRIAYIKIALL